MRSQDEDLFNSYLDATIDNLEAIKTIHAAEAKAVLASVYGLQLAYSPWKGMFLGPKSSSLMEKALKANPSSPLIWKLYGNSKYHTPDVLLPNSSGGFPGYTFTRSISTVLKMLNVPSPFNCE